MARAHALGENTISVPGLAPTLATAGGSNANTDLLSAAVDTTLFGSPRSVVLDANLTAAVTSAKTATVTLKLFDCDTVGGSYTEYTTDPTSSLGPTPPLNHGPQTLVIAAQSAGPNHLMAFYNLAGARRFIKGVLHIVFTASGTDTVDGAISVILGGSDELGKLQNAMGVYSSLQPVNA